MKHFPPTTQTIITISFILLFGSSPLYAGTYADSAHGDTTNGVDSRTTGFETGNCAHCHDQHASRVNTTHTAYNSLRGITTGSKEETLCLDCHDVGGPAADDIDTVIGKTYNHDVASYDWKHSVSDTVEKDAHTASGNASFQGASRHVECSDCHNPHEIGDTDTKHSLGTNLTSGSDQLQGVWGVEPNTDVKWAVATSFTQVDPATKEYQICFKCHTYYALQDADGTTALTGPSGATITDQAKEFSKGNLSAHPIRVGLDSQTGSYLGVGVDGGTHSKKGLTDAQMGASWKSEGTQTMYCSDCHGTENTSSAQGPHGSSNFYMLKGEGGASNNYAFWPTDAANGAGNYLTLKRLVENTNSAQTKVLCMKCHPVFDASGAYNSKTSAYSKGFYNFVHDKHYDKEFDANYGGFSAATPGDVPCIACHSPIPHGNQRARLMAYIGDGAPYTLQISGDTFPVLLGFKKGSGPGEYKNPGDKGYDKENCYINNSICGSHGNNSGTFSGGYD